MENQKKKKIVENETGFIERGQVVFTDCCTGQDVNLENTNRSGRTPFIFSMFLHVRVGLEAEKSGPHIFGFINAYLTL